MIIHKNVNKKISVITVIFNNFDILRDPKIINDDVEYICITDNPNLKSNIWKVIVNPESIKKEWSPRKKTYYIRYHPFEFVSGGYCFWIDASVELNKINFQKYIDKNTDFVLSLYVSLYKYFEFYYSSLIKNTKGCQYLYNVAIGYINMLNLLYNKYKDVYTLPQDIKSAFGIFRGYKNTEHVKEKLAEIYNAVTNFITCENSNIQNTYDNLFYSDVLFFDEPIAGVILHGESVYSLGFQQMINNDEISVYHHNTYNIRFEKK